MQNQLFEKNSNHFFSSKDFEPPPVSNYLSLDPVFSLSSSVKSISENIFNLYLDWDRLTMSYFNNFDNEFLNKY
jgi:hypothetical protein